jgi:micrococcal nuclease
MGGCIGRAVGVAALTLLVGCGGAETDARGAPTSTSSSLAASRSTLPAGDDATVTRVVDGDTIVVSVGKNSVAIREVKVRLIGIDTPETKDPRKPVQCFGREASARTKQLLPEGTSVRLAYDVERNDRYGRTLAYVYRSGVDQRGSFVNAALVRDGYASAYTYPPNVAHADEFVALQGKARSAGRGLWSACDDQVPGPTVPTSTAASGSACDPAYPDVCIPPPPPDLDCGDIQARHFRVLAPDPHRFDSNGDGIGCEGRAP